MPSITLAEAADLSQDMLVSGVIEEIITVNQMFELMPFDGIDGNALKYNREDVLGDVQVLGVNGTITAKAAATFSPQTSSLTTIIGDAEVNGLVQATQSTNGNDQKAIQIASKAKSAGRQYQDMLINGTGSGDEFDGLTNLCVKNIDTGTNGSVFSFDIMDQLQDEVTDKDGQVDYFMMPARTRRSYRTALRAQPGAGINETIELPSGAQVQSYNGIPVFRNDYIPTDVTTGGSSNTTTIFAGTFDDGSRTHGIAGLTASNAAGVQVVEVGESETKDNSITRVKWYCGLALFSENALASAPGITN